MTAHSGNLTKMRTEHGSPIRYHLRLENGDIDVNALLGKKVSIEFNGRINCVSCGKLTRRSFGGGFCYPCFANAPESAECIIRPELCEGHLGKGRDPEWEQRHHVQQHFVYLALSSGLKVGITRSTQIPTRWIDQGAAKAIILADVPYRRLSGEIEVALKQHYSDRTNWQRMLKNQVAEDDLLIRKQEAKAHLPTALQQYVTDDKQIWQMDYPSLDTPLKVKSRKLEKEPLIKGILTGIKGQYLILDNHNVINIRSHSGYHVNIRYE